MEERRNFYRVDDNVILDYERTDKKSSLDKFAESDTAADMKDLLKELRNMDARAQNLIADISRESYEIAEYFRVINQKIDFLATFITNEVVGKLVMQGGDREETRVNISAGGITFPCKEVFKANDFLFVKIALLPDYETVVAKAQVVKCIKGPECAKLPNMTSTKFIELSEYDERVLVKHIYRRQIELEGGKHDDEAE